MTLKLPLWAIIPASILLGFLIMLIQGRSDWYYFWQYQSIVAIIILLIEAGHKWRKR